jgi:cytochrome c-type biogenesis protein CcmE
MLAVGLAAAGLLLATVLTLQAFKENLMFYIEISEVAAGNAPQDRNLFREGQGIIAHGRLDDTGRFVADEVLAKHDENYMPPEVADSLADHAAAQEAVLEAEQQ